MSDERVRSTHERVRTVFDAWARDGSADRMETSHTPFVRQAFETLPLNRRSWYLDIGCGNGYTVRWAAALTSEGRGVGLDLSPEMVERARRLSTGLANVEFHATAFPEHPLPLARFDAILSMEVFYYLPDLDAGLREAERLLAPGGRFACVVDYYGENPASHSWPTELGLELTLLDEAGWRAALERAGLEVADQRRLRAPPGAAAADWQTTAGSLLTLGRKR